MAPKNRFLLWGLPASLGGLAALVFGSGLVAALSGRLGTQVAEVPGPVPTPITRPKATSGGLLIVALGDSLTRGAGDAAGGYPARLADALRREGHPAEVENLAVDGSRADDLLAKLKSPVVADRVRSAGLICLSISGNDLTHALPSSGASAGTSAGTSAGVDDASAALARVRTDLREILDRLRELNATAPIRIIGLYNPLPGGQAERQLSREVLLLWNMALEQAAASDSGALVVPVADLFEERPDRLSTDHFHPGPAGYGEIATRVLSSLPRELTSPAKG